MRDFNVHFSFYSEEFGNFDDVRYSVMAENPFEAREKAWILCDQDDDTLFRRNIKQYAVTWKPNLLDAGDYFYSHAADIKHSLGRLLNVEIPNDQMNNGSSKKRLEADRVSYLTALQTLDDVAKDLYADRGMVPPSIYEELRYAEKIWERLSWSEKSDNLWNMIEKAQKWDRGMVYAIRDMFRSGYVTLCGETTFLNEHFDRNGVYPVHNKLDERDYQYICRWRDKMKINSLKRLPMLKEISAIENSAGHMDYAWRVLLINRDLLADSYRTPENLFWMPVSQDEDGEKVEDAMIYVENLITGECMTCEKDRFAGVLRPDIEAVLDFEALRSEYAAAHGEQGSHDGIADDSLQWTEAEDEDEDFER